MFKFGWLMIAAAPLALLIVTLIEALNSVLVGAMTFVGLARSSRGPGLDFVN